jgi:Cu2+-exporting ATPase
MMDPGSAEGRACFHCGEPCPDDPALRVVREGRSLPVCCTGCKAVSELIFSSGLDRYYQFRESEAIKAPQELEQLQLAWQACDQRPALWGERQPDGQYELLLQTEGVRCAACAWLIRSRLEPMAGIGRVQVDIATGYTRILWDPEQLRMSRIAMELARTGYLPHLPLAAEEERARLNERRQSMRRMGVAGLGMMQVMMYAVGLYAGEALGMTAGANYFLEWTSLLVTIPVVFYSGWVFFTGAAASLRALRPNMDVPVALAIGVAFIASCINFLSGSGDVYFDSVTMFVFFLSVARHVQLVQRQRNASAGAALARLLPEWAERVTGDQAERVLASDIVAGDRIRVRPGEAFPADGQVESGSTEVDEALLTGESRPVAKQPGDVVIGGSVNRSQPVTVLVTATGDESTLSALARMLLKARIGGSRMAGMADQVARVFVLAVLLIAALTGAWWAHHDPSMMMQAVLAVLVVSCPCALSLATPAAMAAASRALLRDGVLLTSSDALEILPRVDVVLFDKTGTLTLGEPEISAVHVNPARQPFSAADARQIAAALEAHSAHPLARAFRGASPAWQLDGDVQHSPDGLGGHVNGQAYRLGKASFTHQGEAGDDDLGAVWLADEHGWVARFELADKLRPGGRALVQALCAEGLRVVVASGDGAAAVSDVARQLGIAQWHARQDPAMKMQLVRQFQAQGHRVLMVGDGVNDAPVLAAADVSMTVQGATELANSAADLILSGQSLALVNQSRQLAQRARRLVRQNLAWAASYNALAIPLAVSGFLQPWMAALGMSASSLLVVANAARVMRERDGAPAAKPTASARLERADAPGPAL